mmetsp:Transcript_37853/g.57928  ORF Transcript_37853/g.57928 Transcript_37853/m.57928 type:complete len:84 (+) Transcript_37853:995-1246(+)
MCQRKMSELSFEVKPDWDKAVVKEAEDIQEIIDTTVESYRLLKKSGQLSEAKEMKEKIRETKYAKEHLKMVMSMDFTRPTDKL